MDRREVLALCAGLAAFPALARAGGNMALTGQLHCWMDAHIRREGWT